MEYFQEEVSKGSTQVVQLQRTDESWAEKKYEWNIYRKQMKTQRKRKCELEKYNADEKCDKPCKYGCVQKENW